MIVMNILVTLQTLLVLGECVYIGLTLQSRSLSDTTFSFGILIILIVFAALTFEVRKDVQETDKLWNEYGRKYR